MPTTAGSTSGRSELECFVLGLLWQFGPCSPYDVRSHLRESPSSQWSGSAGAIYPLIRRLERARLVAAKTQRRGERRRREYRLTRAGLAALRRWVGPTMGDGVVTVVHDPLRSRARFLAVLSPRDRLAWVRNARRSLDLVEHAVSRWDALFGRNPPTTAVARILTDHGRRDIAFRRAWLRTVESALPALGSPEA